MRFLVCLTAFWFGFVGLTQAGTDGYGDWYVGKFKGYFYASTSETKLNFGDIKFRCEMGTIQGTINYFNGQGGGSNEIAEFRVDGSGPWTRFYVVKNPSDVVVDDLAPGRHPIIDAMMNGSSYIEVRPEVGDRFQRSTFSLRGSTKALQGFLDRCPGDQTFDGYVALAQELVGKNVFVTQPGRFATDDEWGDETVAYDEMLRVVDVVTDRVDIFKHTPITLVLEKENGLTGYFSYGGGRYRLQSIENRGWSPEIVSAIAKSEVMVGMTTEQVVESWGEPMDRNDSLVAGHGSSQWVYIGHYIYFENDRLKAWQDR